MKIKNLYWKQDRKLRQMASKRVWHPRLVLEEGNIALKPFASPAKRGITSAAAKIFIEQRLSSH